MSAFAPAAFPANGDAAARLAISSGVMPASLRWGWAVMAVLMALGGWVWAYKLVKGLNKYYREKRKAEQRADGSVRPGHGPEADLLTASEAKKYGLQYASHKKNKDWVAAKYVKI